MIVTGLLVKELVTTCTHYSVKSFNKRMFIGTYIFQNYDSLTFFVSGVECNLGFFESSKIHKNE